MLFISGSAAAPRVAGARCDEGRSAIDGWKTARCGRDRKDLSMKTSTKLAALALAAATANAIVTLPASAGPVRSCSNPSGDKTITTKCVTDTNDVGNHKISKENWADQPAVQASGPQQPAAKSPPTVTVPDWGTHAPAPPTVTVPDWGTHVRYPDILSGKAARGGTTAGNGGSGGAARGAAR